MLLKEKNNLVFILPYFPFIIRFKAFNLILAPLRQYITESDSEIKRKGFLTGLILGWHIPLMECKHPPIHLLQGVSQGREGS